MSGGGGNPGYVPRRTTTLDWRQTLAAFARYWLIERGTIVLVFVLLFAMIGAEALTPVALGRLVDAVSNPGRADPANILWHHFAFAGGTMTVAIILKQLLDRLWNGLTARSMQRLQMDLFARVQRMSADWHSNAFSGATVHRISRARWALDMISNIIILRLLQPLLLMLVLGGMMYVAVPYAGIAFFICTGFYLTVSWFLSAKWVRPLGVISASRDSRLTGALADAVTNNATVKAFAAEAREDKRLQSVSNEWLAAAAPSFNRATDTNAIQMLLWTITQMSVLGAIAWQATLQKAGTAELAFAISALLMLSGQLRTLGQDIRVFQRAYAELEDAAEFLLSDPVELAPSAEPAKIAVEGAIRFEQVSFAYPNGGAVYRDLSFTIDAGEQVALVGPSGSGKSTIVKMIQRLYEPQQGKILIDGNDVASMQLEQLRSITSVVPQEPVLFHRSLAENIAYGRPDASLEDIIDAAKRARAHDFIVRLEKGYDMVVGERGAKLSGGERQRIAIARAILADRPILLLDEATSSLDTETERLVQEAVCELAYGRTTIVIAHRLSTVEQVDRILVFDDGAIVEEGSHTLLMQRRNGRYRQLFDIASHRPDALICA